MCRKTPEGNYGQKRKKLDSYMTYFVSANEIIALGSLAFPALIHDIIKHG